MRHNIKGTNIQLTDAITSYLDKRLATLERFVNADDPTLMVDVEVGKTTFHHQSGDVFRAEINIHVSGKSYRSVAERSDLYSAIDEAKDSMKRELASNKDKRTSLLRRGGQRIKDFVRGFYKK